MEQKGGWSIQLTGGKMFRLPVWLSSHTPHREDHLPAFFFFFVLFHGISVPPQPAACCRRGSEDFKREKWEDRAFQDAGPRNRGESSRVPGEALRLLPRHTEIRGRDESQVRRKGKSTSAAGYDPDPRRRLVLPLAKPRTPPADRRRFSFYSIRKIRWIINKSALFHQLKSSSLWHLKQLICLSTEWCAIITEVSADRQLYYFWKIKGPMFSNSSALLDLPNVWRETKTSFALWWVLLNTGPLNSKISSKLKCVAFVVECDAKQFTEPFLF